eukprot:TRINITY_DN5276_c0_g1_i2.p1 TRINITY_DN5276_c0_g1~~TRINITY_DN5276_c0_g1_i2.p1  ORF type:complete len:180 (-),score=34.22 TRINITY_DN5276_c0_g1_i2:170-709(-)
MYFYFHLLLIIPCARVLCISKAGDVSYFATNSLSVVFFHQQARPLIKSSVDGGWNFKDIFSSPKSEQLDKLDPRPVMILINEYQIFCRKWSNQVSRNQKSLAVKMKEVEFASTKVRDTVHMQTNDMRVFANQFREVEKLRQQMDELNQIVRRVLQQTEQLRLLLPEQDRPASFQDTIAN